eukprot:Skav224619  [mRNA]  locus=scaffold2059:58560:64714:- [translate_table: standard]
MAGPSVAMPDLALEGSSEPPAARSARHRTATPPPRLKPLPLAHVQEAELPPETSSSSEAVWMQRKVCDAPIERPEETPKKRQQWPGIQQRSIIALARSPSSAFLRAGSFGRGIAGARRSPYTNEKHF